MNLKQVYNDVLGSAGLDYTHPRVFMKLVRNVSLPRISSVLYSELYYGRFVWSLIRQKNPDRFMPKIILVEPTYRCNLSCMDCYAPKEEQDMDRDTFKLAVEQAERIGIHRFTMLGGEPTMPHIMPMTLDTIRDHKRSYFLFCTNGTFIDDSLVSDILPINNVGFHLSIDGPKQYTDYRRGNGVYEKAISGLRRLHEARVLRNVVATLRSETWKDQLSFDFIEQLVNLGVSVLSIRETVKCDKMRDRIDPRLYLNHLFAITKEFPIYIADGYYGKIVGSKIIPRTSSIVTVSPSGNVRLDRFSQEGCFGNIKEEGLEHILRDERVQRLKSQVRASRREEVKHLLSLMK